MELSKLWVGLYWIWISSEFLLQVVTRTTRRSGTIMDRGSLPLLVGTIFCSIWAAMSLAGTPGHQIPGGAHRLLAVAIVLMLVGIVIRWTAILTLGLSFSTNVAIHASQTLCKTGLFRYLRHPSYTGMLVSFAAVGVSQRNWISLAIVLIFPIMALAYRIHVEEAALKAAFGEDYIAYSRSTSRILPGIY